MKCHNEENYRVEGNFNICSSWKNNTTFRRLTPSSSLVTFLNVDSFFQGPAGLKREKYPFTSFTWKSLARGRGKEGIVKSL